MTLPFTETPAAAPLPAAAGLTPGTVPAPGEGGSVADVEGGEAFASATLPLRSAAPVLSLIVHGTPGPQGSKNGWLAPNGVDVLMRESSKKVKPWRRVVRETAKRALPDGWTLLDEAIVLEMVFTLHRGKTVRRLHPTVYPDLSKLARSTEDALTGVVWKDDARIVEYRTLAKRYPLEGDDALTYPGVVVRVYTVTGDR